MLTLNVRLDQELVDKANMGKALNRTMPKQIKHWAKIGEISITFKSILNLN